MLERQTYNWFCVGARVHFAVGWWLTLSSRQKVQNVVNLDTKITVHCWIANDTASSAALYMAKNGNPRQTGTVHGIFLSVAKMPEATHWHEDKTLCPPNLSWAFLSIPACSQFLQIDYTNIFYPHSIVWIVIDYVGWDCIKTLKEVLLTVIIPPFHTGHKEIAS